MQKNQVNWSEGRRNRHFISRIFGAFESRTAVLVALWLLTMGTVCGETIFESDFTVPPPKDQIKLSRGCGIADGVLKIGRKEGKFFEQAEFAVKLDAPFTMSFAIRMTGFSQPDHHFGPFLVGPDGKSYRFGSRNGINFGALLTVDGRIVKKAGFPEKIKDEAGDGGRMIPVELRVETGFVEMKVDGHSLGAVPLEFMPIQRVGFYAYNTEILVDDLKISRLELAQTKPSQNPVFSADFDHGVNAVDENNQVIAPTSAAKPELVPGVAGSALNARRDQKFQPLIYDVGEILGNEGAVMFWTSPGARNMDTLLLLDKEGKERLACRAMNYGYAIRLTRPDGEKYDFFSRGSKYLARRDSWNHYAVTWDQTGAIRIFRNGLPYRPNNSWEPNIGYSSGLNFADVRKIRIPESCDSTLDNLKIYRRKVSPDEVYAEFRQSSPLDVVIPDAVVQPEDAAAFTVELVPGGTYTRPVQGDKPLTGFKGELTLTLHPQGKEDTVLKTLIRPVEVIDAPVDIKFPVGKLPEGEYLVMWQLKSPDGKLMRRGIVTECRALPSPAAAATKTDVKPGKLLFEKRFSDVDDPALLKEGAATARGEGGIELGVNKGDRIATVIPGLQEYLQKPLLIEVEWPDDAPRMMGIYVYLENAKGESYRDRLQGGIQAGLEYPNTGKTVTTRYLFWPQTPTALFEVRTMAKNYPAAITALRVYAIDGERLPRLEITRPAGMDFRKIGNADEDQTLSTTMARRSLHELTERICDYLDYTGQDTFHYAMLRYYFSFFPLPESSGQGMYPELPGGLGYLIDALGQRGKKFVGIYNLSNLPESYYAKVLEQNLLSSGMVMLDKDRYELESYVGASGTPNIANPEVRKLAARYLLDFRDDLKKPNVEGVSIWHAMWWNSLDEGYDSYTVNKFARETGIKVPDTGRYEFLISKAVLPKWREWRALQVFELIRELRRTLDAINPALNLYVMKRGDYDWDEALEPMLARLPNTFACDMRRPTSYRWGFHWGKPETDLDERMYDFDAARQLFKRKSNRMVTLFYIYYETFTKSLSKQYGCYFQSADVKPWGRYFLKELAFNVAAGDVWQIAMGGQPFGSWGRDPETREFTQAFSALPAQDFVTVDNPNPSITVRYLNTKNGTYFYLVSMVYLNSAAKLEFGGAVPEYVDLSTGEKRSGATIELKPFQLRSFLIPNREVKITGAAYTFPPELNAFYREKIARLKSTLEKLAAHHVEVKAERECLKRIGALLRAENYAEVHRLAFSPLMNQLLRKSGNIGQVTAQGEMLRNSHIAVNCGSGDFCTAADGRLFFPDRSYDDSGKYGYFGRNKSVVRKTDGLKDPVTPDLFQTEAYDIDGYKFRLANGKYTVRLYLKVGYPDDFKADNVIFTVYAQGQPLFRDLDLFRAGGGDFKQPVVKEFKNIPVTGGELVLKFETPKGRPTNHRLCNAIEVIPEK